METFYITSNQIDMIYYLLELTLVSQEEFIFCSKTCSDGNRCGGDLGFFTVYDSEATRPKSVSFVAEVVTSEVRTFFVIVYFL